MELLIKNVLNLSQKDAKKMELDSENEVAILFLLLFVDLGG